MDVFNLDTLMMRIKVIEVKLMMTILMMIIIITLLMFRSGILTMEAVLEYFKDTGTLLPVLPLIHQKSESSLDH